MSKAMAAGLRAAAPAPWTMRPAIEHPFGAGAGRQERARREQRRPGAEHAAPAEEVGDPAEQQQQAAERHHVGVDHPAQRPGVEIEVGLNGRQRHVDDGRVQHDDELRRNEQREGYCSTALVASRGGSSGGGCGASAHVVHRPV